MRIIKGSLFAIGGAMLLAGAISAGADSPETVERAPVVDTFDANRRSVRVRYDDLDLSRDEGVEALYARLSAAARRACGHYNRRSIRERRGWRQCYGAALAAAMEDVESVDLAELASSSDGASRSLAPRIVAERDARR